MVFRAAESKRRHAAVRESITAGFKASRDQQTVSEGGKGYGNTGLLDYRITLSMSIPYAALAKRMYLAASLPTASSLGKRLAFDLSTGDARREAIYGKEKRKRVMSKRSFYRRHSIIGNFKQPSLLSASVEAKW